MVMGDRLNHYKIIGMKPLLETGFNVVYDPDFLPILIGILLVGLGLVLTFIQKIGDKKLW